MSDLILLLVVEDEPLLRDILSDGLAEAGFDLLLKSDGASAIAELERSARQIRIVLTDIRLGAGPSGWDVGRRARELHPEMAVIYMSGDSAANWLSKGVPRSVMIQKPYVIAQIVTAVANLLNEDSA